MLKSLKCAVLALALLASCSMMAMAADIQERTIRLPIANPLEHPQGIGAVKFAELVKAKSDGKIDVKVFPNGSLGGEIQMIPLLQSGNVDASMMGPALLASLAKDFTVLEFPFSFETEDKANAALDGPLGRKLLDQLPEKGLVGLVYMEQGYRSISNSRRPVEKIEDISGLKLRVVQNPLHIAIFTTLGANAVPLPFPELYTALETGTVDGQENPLLTVDTSKFYEVQKYVSLTKHIYVSQVLLFSKAFWDKLSDDERALLTQAAEEARDYQRKTTRDLTNSVRDKLVSEHNMQINDITPEEHARMRQALQPVIEKFSAEISPDVLDTFTAATK